MVGFALKAACRLAVPLAVLLLSGCGSVAPHQAPPVHQVDIKGSPVAYGWDGVDRVMMMSACTYSGTYSATESACSTWILGDGTWQLARKNMWLPRNGAGTLVYDPGRNREVFIFSPSFGNAETWEWDGSVWRRMPVTPGQIGTASAAYSPDLHAIVVTAPLTVIELTWTYDGTNWSSVKTAAPSPLPGDLQYDAALHAVVGLTGYQAWAFEGGAWMQLAVPSITPQLQSGVGRQSPATAFDQHLGRYVVFGGFDGYNEFADTWTGDGSSWIQATTASAPAARHTAVMAWDPGLRGAILFGGIRSVNSTLESLTDTWRWDGRMWTYVSGPIPSPAPPTPGATPASGAR
jgi:hypothetical protein